MPKVEWISHNRKARCKPNPKYPKGIDVDLAGKAKGCVVKLPYPAPECGVHLVTCDECGVKAAITAAGRVDDPKSVRLRCRRGH